MDKRFSLSERSGRGVGDEGWEPLELEFEPGQEASFSKRATATTRAPVFTMRRFAVAVAVVAVVVLVANLTLPWLYSGISGVDGLPADAGPKVRDRGDIRSGNQFGFAGGTTDYGGRLLDWPLVASVVLVLAGPLLYATTLPLGISSRAQRTFQAVVLTGIGFTGFLIALTGTRWLGTYFAFLMRDVANEPFDVVYHLHVVPYINLAVGFGLLAGALFLMGRVVPAIRWRASPAGGASTVAMRVSGLTAVVLVAGLLLLPVLPYMSVDEGRFYWTEGTLSSLAELDGQLDDELANATAAAKGVAGARIVFWVLLFVSIATFLVALVDLHSGGSQIARLLGQLQALVLPGVVLAVVFTLIFYVRGSATEQAELFFNPALPLTVVALGVAAWLYLKRVLLPFWDEMKPVLQASNGEEPVVGSGDT